MKKLNEFEIKGLEIIFNKECYSNYEILEAWKDEDSNTYDIHIDFKNRYIEWIYEIDLNNIDF